ncbi:MAG: hypothetical protein IPJ37_12790 [Bacteroidales bacterium]|nr:hypothetical protein [Bacteroidales bacterium]
MKVKFCKTEVEYPGEKLGELRDSGHLKDNMDELKERIKQDGYLFLRNFLPLKWSLKPGRRLLVISMKIMRL